MKVIAGLIASISIVLAGCGGGGGSSVPVSVSNSYTISGAVSGLSNGNQVILLNSGGNAVTVTSNGKFSFSNPIAYTGSYAVTIGTQPEGQNCAVSNGTGTGIAANVIDISVICDGTNNYTGTVTTFAGNGALGSADGAGVNASFYVPVKIAVDASGNIYVSENQSHKIRKITSAGVVSTFAGSGVRGFGNGTGTDAAFSSPAGLAVDANGNVYVADSGNNKIRKITPAGVVSTFAGSGVRSSADGIGLNATFNNPAVIAFDTNGNLFVGEGGQKIRKITAAGVVSTLAGTGATGSADGTGANATFNFPWGLALDALGNVYVADNNKIRKITSVGLVSTLAGTGATGSADGTGAIATFQGTSGITVDASGNLYVVDDGNSKIRKVTPAGVVSTLAGTGAAGDTDGRLQVAKFKSPQDIAFDASGNLYVADSGNNKIRKITLQ